LSFFSSVSHLSILQDSKCIAIYIRSIDKKKKYITRKKYKKEKDIGEREYLILVKDLNFH
jgi:hypothetical protein